MNSAAILASTITATSAGGVDTAVQFAFRFTEDERLMSMYVRSVPTLDAPRPRWIKTSINMDDDKNLNIGQIDAHIQRKLLSGGSDSIIHRGLFSVEITETDQAEFDSGAAQPNSLFTRVVTALDGTAPRDMPYATVRALSTWLIDGPMKTMVDAGDLTPFTESPLSKMMAPIIPVDLSGLEGGIKLRDGSTFLRVDFWDGLDNVTFAQMAYDANLPWMALGEPGVGKSVLMEAAYDVVYTITCDDYTARDVIVGGHVPVSGKPGQFIWRDAAMIMAIRAAKRNQKREAKGLPTKRVVLFIDEITQIGDTKALVGCVYPAMTSGWVELPEFPDHDLLEPMIPLEYKGDADAGYKDAVEVEDFEGTQDEWLATLPKGINTCGLYICFAGNPNVPGAVMSEALKSRAKLTPEYTTNYDAVATIMGPDHEAIITVARNMEAKRQAGEVMWAPQFREMMAYLQTASSKLGGGIALSNLVSKCESDADKDILTDVISRTLGISNIRPFRI